MFTGTTCVDDCTYRKTFDERKRSPDWLEK